MKTFLLSFLITVLANSVFAFPDNSDLRQEIGWFKGTSTAVGVSEVYTSVHRIRMQNSGTCSSVMIAPNVALTAAHCMNSGVRNWRQDLGSEWGEVIYVKDQFVARNYRSGTVNRLSQEDWGLLILQKDVPENVAILEIAQPEELYVGQPARSVGYPARIGNAEKRIVGKDCSVRSFSGDNILTDCYISRGMSGGPLLVQTREGKWKIAGICSEQYMVGVDQMVLGDSYRDAIANRYVNVTLYRERIIPHIEKQKKLKLKLKTQAQVPVPVPMREIDI